ncbi:hypothetical protein GCM10027160_38220 [Streptomyces calidiresistens]
MSTRPEKGAWPLFTPGAPTHSPKKPLPPRYRNQQRRNGRAQRPDDRAALQIVRTALLPSTQRSPEQPIEEPRLPVARG